jgi:predicted nuclease with TOPRIM domain
VTAALDIKKDYLKAAEQRDALKAENAELKKKLTAKGFDALEAQLGKARERIVELESQLAKALP